MVGLTLGTLGTESVEGLGGGHIARRPVKTTALYAVAIKRLCMQRVL